MNGFVNWMADQLEPFMNESRHYQSLPHAWQDTTLSMQTRLNDATSRIEIIENLLVVYQKGLSKLQELGVSQPPGDNEAFEYADFKMTMRSGIMYFKAKIAEIARFVRRQNLAVNGTKTTN